VQRLQASRDHNGQGYGLANSVDILTSLAPRAELKPVFSMEADQERRTLEQVRGWLGG